MTDGSPTPGWLSWTQNVTADPSWGRSALRRITKVAVPRKAAVLVLFGGAPVDTTAPPPDADVLLLQRAVALRSHGGQVAFPGGAVDPDDDGPIATALREAQEETGLDPTGVQPLKVLSPVYVPPSRFDVTPVLAYWQRPSPVQVMDEAESQRVIRVPLATLTDPANRFQVRHPLGFQGPAFEVGDMLVWGFTAGILASLITAADWELDWDHNDMRDLEQALAGREHR